MRGDRLLLGAALLLPGCYASNVVARTDRVVADEAVPADWAPAAAGDLDGLFESVLVRGEAALALRWVCYWFGRDGRYAGAALVDGDDGMAFQTLNGRWTLTPRGLVLDAAEPAPLQAAGRHLRLVSATGELVLRRSDLR